MLLALDTSSFALSCALAEEDQLIAEWTVQKALTHSERLIPHIERLLIDVGVKKSDITAIAVAKGPGSFTGLRIGITTAKVVSYLWKVPLVGVDTLEALAWNMKGAQAFILAIEDAQRGNVYAVLYSAFGELWQQAPTVVAPIEDVVQAALRNGGPILAVGEAADLYKGLLESAGIRLASPQNRFCRASSVAFAGWHALKQGRTENPLALVPNYIRRSEAEVLWEKRNGEKQ